MSLRLSLAFFWLLLAQSVQCTRETSTTEINQFQVQGNRTVPFQVIGAGQAKTGTTTLHYALEILGIQPVHDWPDTRSPSSPVDLWSEQIILKKQGKYNAEDGIWDTAEQWDQVLDRYAAIVDAPGHMFVAELARAYPEAKVILTMRDSPEVWLESYQATVYALTRLRKWLISYQVKSFVQWVMGTESNTQKIRRAVTYGDGWAVKPPQIWWYTEHLEHVRKYVPAERLLEYNVKEGWGPLCEFLGKDVPDTPFPHANSREDWLKKSEKLGASVAFEWQCALSVGSACFIMWALLRAFRPR